MQTPYSANLPSVTIILVTFNSAAFIDKALESIQALAYPQECIETVVVDNASQDNTVARVREQFPWVKIMPQATNRDFAAANNAGMRSYPADYFALVNHDVVLHPDWLASLIAAMQAESSIGAAGSKIFFGNRILLQHTGGMIRDNALTYHLGANEFDIGQYNEQCEVDYVMGAALLLRGDAARSVGYLPEVYFLYYEEVEFCLRLRERGDRVIYVPGAVAYHDEKRSGSGAMTHRFLKLYHKYRYLYALRNITTVEEQRRFCKAEREWCNRYVRSPFGRALLLRSKLYHWRLLLKNRWLLAS